MVPWENDKPTIVALREIEEGLIDVNILEEKEESHEILSLDMLTANLNADENTAPPITEE